MANIFYRGNLEQVFIAHNAKRLQTALRKEHNNEAIIPVVTRIRLTHWLTEGYFLWRPCREEDVSYDNGNEVTCVYSDLWTEHVLPVVTLRGDNDLSTASLANVVDDYGVRRVMDLTSPMELTFESYVDELPTKLLSNGTILRHGCKETGRVLRLLQSPDTVLTQMRYL
jgi:hypothetical protein